MSSAELVLRVTALNDSSGLYYINAICCFISAYSSSLLFHEETGVISFLRKTVALDEVITFAVEKDSSFWARNNFQRVSRHNDQPNSFWLSHVPGIVSGWSNL